MASQFKMVSGVQLFFFKAEHGINLLFYSLILIYDKNFYAITYCTSVPVHAHPSSNIHESTVYISNFHDSYIVRWSVNIFCNSEMF